MKYQDLLAQTIFEAGQVHIKRRRRGVRPPTFEGFVVRVVDSLVYDDERFLMISLVGMQALGLEYEPREPYPPEDFS